MFKIAPMAKRSKLMDLPDLGYGEAERILRELAGGAWALPTPWYQLGKVGSGAQEHYFGTLPDGQEWSPDDVPEPLYTRMLYDPRTRGFGVAVRRDGSDVIPRLAQQVAEDLAVARDEVPPLESPYAIWHDRLTPLSIPFGAPDATGRMRYLWPREAETRICGLLRSAAWTITEVFIELPRKATP